MNIDCAQKQKMADNKEVESTIEIARRLFVVIKLLE